MEIIIKTNSTKEIEEILNFLKSKNIAGINLDIGEIETKIDFKVMEKAVLNYGKKKAANYKSKKRMQNPN